MNFKLLTGENIIWKTGTGIQIPVRNMSSLHIKNCLRCLIGKGNMEIPKVHFGRPKHEWFNIFCVEMSRRGEPIQIGDLL